MPTRVRRGLEWILEWRLRRAARRALQRHLRAARKRTSTTPFQEVLARSDADLRKWILHARLALIRRMVLVVAQLVLFVASLRYVFHLIP